MPPLRRDQSPAIGGADDDYLLYQEEIGMTSVLIDEDRFARQRELVPIEKLAATAATVIGVGAIGRQVALQLAAIGIRQLQLVDFDHVELTNVTTQGYWRDDIGQTKVQATAAAIARIDPSITVEPICDRFRPRIPLGGAVFSCVDRIETRAVIWRTARECCQFWADARMLGEVARVLVAVDAQTRDYYHTTLFRRQMPSAAAVPPAARFTRPALPPD